MKQLSVLMLVLFVGMVFSQMTSLPMKHHFLERDHPLHNHFLHRRGSTAMEDFQMGGNIYPVGIYWISVGLGTPVQSLLAAVDSGSSDLIVPSPTCEVSINSYLFLT